MKCVKLGGNRWKKNVIILTEFSSLTALEVVNFIKLTTFHFHRWYAEGSCRNLHYTYFHPIGIAGKNGQRTTCSYNCVLVLQLRLVAHYPCNNCSKKTLMQILSFQQMWKNFIPIICVVKKIIPRYTKVYPRFFRSKVLHWHHSSVIVCQITGNSTVCWTVCLGVHQNKTSKLPVTVPLWGESTRHCGIPLTKGH